MKLSEMLYAVLSEICLIIGAIVIGSLLTIPKDIGRVSGILFILLAVFFRLGAGR